MDIVFRYCVYNLSYILCYLQVLVMYCSVLVCSEYGFFITSYLSLLNCMYEFYIRIVCPLKLVKYFSVYVTKLIFLQRWITRTFQDL